MQKNFQEEWAKIEDRCLSGKDEVKFSKLKEQLLNGKNVLFGVGELGPHVAEKLMDIGVFISCFCANRNTGRREPITGLPVISTEQLIAEYPNAMVIITASSPQNQEMILKQLIDYGFPKDKVITYVDTRRFWTTQAEKIARMREIQQKYLSGYERVYHLFHDEASRKIIIDRLNGMLFGDGMDCSMTDIQYFPNELVFDANEVFVDAGVYRGETTEDFIRRVDGKYKKVVGFEIDSLNIKDAQEKLKQYPNIELIDKGLWSGSTVMHADLGKGYSSNIDANGKTEVGLVSLDELFQNQPQTEWPTFIKMDIEGAEKEALIGAQKIIQTKRPKLAICVYHKPEDLYELTELILSYVPDYQIILQQYSTDITETVLYAWT